MKKTGNKRRTYSPEFKLSVILDIRENHLSYKETVRRYELRKIDSGGARQMLQRWERKEGLEKENRAFMHCFCINARFWCGRKERSDGIARDERPGIEDVRRYENSLDLICTSKSLSKLWGLLQPETAFFGL